MKDKDILIVIGLILLFDALISLYYAAIYPSWLTSNYANIGRVIRGLLAFGFIVYAIKIN